MATCKVSIQFVLREAAQMVVTIDQIRATSTDRLVNAAMQKRRWFSGKPVYTTHTQALEALAHRLEEIEIRNEGQRKHCQSLMHLCQAALVTGSDEKFVNLSEEDIWQLGFNQPIHLQIAFEEFHRKPKDNE